MSLNAVRYIHNNEIIEIINPDPNETLLNYIRNKLNKSGT